MNPFASRLVLRPRTSFEVADLAVAHARRELRPLAALAAVTVLPAWIVAVLLGFVAGHRVWAAALVVLFAPALQAPFTWLAGTRVFDASAGLGDLARAWRPVVRGAVLAVVRQVVVVLSGPVSLGFGTPAVGIFLTWTVESAVLERRGLADAVLRAVRLAAAAGTRTAIVWLGGLGVWAWGVVAFETTAMLVVGFVLQLGTPFGLAMDGVLTPWVLLGWLAVQPAVAVYRLVAWLDVRTISEGWDVHLALRAAAEDG